jgi:hypothetical protein
MGVLKLLMHFGEAIRTLLGRLFPAPRVFNVLPFNMPRRSTLAFGASLILVGAVGFEPTCQRRLGYSQVRRPIAVSHPFKTWWRVGGFEPPWPLGGPSAFKTAPFDHSGNSP